MQHLTELKEQTDNTYHIYKQDPFSYHIYRRTLFTYHTQTFFHTTFIDFFYHIYKQVLFHILSWYRPFFMQDLFISYLLWDRTSFYIIFKERPFWYHNLIVSDCVFFLDFFLSWPFIALKCYQNCIVTYNIYMSD